MTRATLSASILKLRGLMEKWRAADCVITARECADQVDAIFNEIANELKNTSIIDPEDVPGFIKAVRLMGLNADGSANPEEE
jgi:hypothetical protein